ncbi:hypothetical protein LCGC14_0334760 [marine sediment metagenome]|uniref:Uncharacterized protein n=1 Tax=marine sediment metagenome TaxID=412755 RepID=A0A0F9WMV8_9ZZZZ
MSVTLGTHREPVPLNSEDGKLHVWACGACAAAYGGKLAEKTALECCAEMLCDCGKPVDGKHCTSCYACRVKTQDAKEQALFDKAEKIPWREYDGEMVYSDRQEFYPDVDSMVDAEDDPPDDPPRWAWACTSLKLKFNAMDLVNGQLEADDHHEESRSYIGDNDVAELQKLLDAWCEKQTVETFFPDYSRVVTCDDIVDERLADQHDEDPVSEGK